MKKFGLYTLKASAIQKYIEIEPRLSEAKSDLRPAICLKDKRGQNWLLPVTSLDPDKSNYTRKTQIISAQEKQERKLKVKAIMRFPNITRYYWPKNPSYESVILFYHAIPVKQADVRKITLNNKHCQVNLAARDRLVIENNFNAYMSRYFNGQASGFLLNYQNNGTDFSAYQYKSKEIKRELYKTHYAQLRKRREAQARLAELRQERQRKKELRRRVRDELIAVGADPSMAAANARLLISKAQENLDKQNDRSIASTAVGAEASIQKEAVPPLKTPKPIRQSEKSRKK